MVKYIKNDILGKNVRSQTFRFFVILMTKMLPEFAPVLHVFDVKVIVTK